MSRFRRSVITSVAGAGGSVLVIVTGFITTPLLLRYLGSTRFGAFRAATDWFGYVGLLEFGIGGALQAVFAKALGTDSQVAVVAGIRAGMRAYLLAAGAMMVVSVGLAVSMPWLINVPGNLRFELWTGCGISLISIVWMPLAVFRPLAEAEQRGYLVHLVNTAQLLTAMVGSLAFAVFGWGLAGQFLGVLAGNAVFNLTLAWYGLRRFPEVIGSDPHASRPHLWSLSWPTLLFNLSGRLSLFSDNILIAGFLGVTAVTPFVLTQRLVQTAGSQVTVLIGASWAGLIDLYYRGEQEVFTRRLTQVTRLVGVAGGAFILPVAVWNQQLVELWVGTDRYAGSLVTWLTAMNAWELAILSLWGWPLMAAGRVRAMVPMQATCTAVNLGVSVAGTAAIGLPGPLLGTTVMFTGLAWWWLLILIRRELGVAPTALLKAAIRPALLACPYTLGLARISDLIPAFHPNWPIWSKWAALAGWLTTAAVGYLVLAWFLAFPASDRAEWFSRFREWHRRLTVTPTDLG